MPGSDATESGTRVKPKENGATCTEILTRSFSCEPATGNRNTGTLASTNPNIEKTATRLISASLRLNPLVDPAWVCVRLPGSNPGGRVRPLGVAARVLPVISAAASPGYWPSGRDFR